MACSDRGVGSSAVPHSCDAIGKSSNQGNANELPVEGEKEKRGKVVPGSSCALGLKIL